MQEDKLTFEIETETGKSGFTFKIYVPMLYLNDIRVFTLDMKQKMLTASQNSDYVSGLLVLVDIIRNIGKVANNG